MAKRSKIKKGQQSALRLIKRCAEFIPQDKIYELPRYARGIYVLFKQNPKMKKKFDVVYVGMATRRMLDRLKSHKRHKRNLWTHFSVFDVWDNIRDDEISELEGILRHIYRRDSKANAVNKQKSFKKIKAVRNDNLRQWKSICWDHGNIMEVRQRAKK